MNLGEIVFICVSLKNFLEERSLSEPSAEAKVRQRSSKDLVSDKQLASLLSQLRSENSWPELSWTILVTISGRRFKDISRVKWRNVQTTETGVFCLINRDKVSQHKNVNFGFNWSDWDVDFDLNEFKTWFLKSLKDRKSGFVVKGANQEKLACNMKQKIKRRGGFRLHSIRNRRAIACLISGKSEEQTRQKIGWRSLTTLYRYTIINSEEISKCVNYEQCRRLILNRDD